MADALNRLLRRLPVWPFYVVMLLPAALAFWQGVQGTLGADPVRALNHEYAAITRDADATWLDLWPVLSDGAGSLRAQFTGDSLHLNGAGYAAWVEALRPLLTAG